MPEQPDSAGTCPQCGSDVPASARFCTVCGYTLTTRTGQLRSPRPSHTTATQTADTAPSKQHQTTDRVQPARPAVRCSAFLLDLATMISPALPLTTAAAVLGVAQVIYIVIPVAFVAVWAWIQIWQGLTGTSLGKAMLGLRLVSAAEHRPPGVAPTLARSVVFAATLGLAGLPVVLGSGGQPGLHDRVSGLTLLDVTLGANPLGPRQQTTLRRATVDRGLHRVHSPIPVTGSRRG